MTPTELWQRYQKYLYHNDSLGLSLDISRMNFDDKFWPTIEPRLQQAYDAMQALEAGAIANPDEGRKVGHYWLRAPQLAPEEIQRDIKATLKDIKNFTAQIHSGGIAPEQGGKFKNLLLVGIGGSALGPQFVTHALGEPTDRMRCYFFDNTDPDGFSRTLGFIGEELAETLTIVISKSGGTKETRNGMLEAQAAYHEAGLHFGRHAVAITEAGSALDKVAESERWLERFPMWDWVGGRTSELSAVGLLPAALQGYDINEMLRGAMAMDEATRSRDTIQNPAAILAAMWYHATGGNGQKDMVILPYRDRLELLTRYLQQLVMESLGKEHDLDGNVVHQGIAVYGNKGSTDQHAYVQQLRDGVPNFFATFIDVSRNSSDATLEVEPGVMVGDYLFGFLYGTRQALYEKGRENLTLTICELNANSVGQLIALFERAVGFYATLVNVNAYHQPGVEAGKKAAQSLLELQGYIIEALHGLPGSALTADEVAAELDRTDDTENVYHLLTHLAARQAVEQIGTGPSSSFRIA